MIIYMRNPMIYFIICIVFGIYFINYALGFWKIPDFLTGANPWIIFVGGILIVLGGIFSLRNPRRRYYR